MSIKPFGRPAPVKRRWRAEFMLRQKALCHWCQNVMQTSEPRSWDYATFDHLKRRREGGTSRKDNLVLACKPCNWYRD